MKKSILLALGIFVLCISAFLFLYNYTEVIDPIKILESMPNNTTTLSAVGTLFFGGALIFWYSNLKDAKE